MPFFSKDELLKVLKSEEIYLQKKRGQCFLIDPQIVDIIVKNADLNPNSDIILEIGPGLGTITDKLIENSKRTILIENDIKNALFLKNYFQKKYSIQYFSQNQLSEPNKIDFQTKVVLINEDALKIQWPQATKIISNIPYNISGPLLFKILSNWNYDKVLLMVQKEFADRLTAQVNSSNYSRLTAAIGLYLNIHKIQNVSRYSFYPQPRVTSSIIEITFKFAPKDDHPKIKNQNLYLDLLEGIFPYKNKSLRKALKIFFENRPQFIKKLPHLYKIAQPSKYTGFLRRKIRSFSSEEYFQLLRYGQLGESSYLPKFK